MFQFPACPPVRLWIHLTVTDSSSAGFPHSDINGSMPACRSPLLFAACHVLLRRMVPGHPPCALCSLIFSSILRPIDCKNLLLPKLVFSESFLLCSCQGAMPRAVRVRLLTASLEDDTEFKRVKVNSLDAADIVVSA